MKNPESGRLGLLDSLRGLTLISMILYHACWDAVYLMGADWPWYWSRAGYIWQQSICWTFILLSGFCVPFSSRLLRRGLEVFGAGALVMLVTNLVLPEDRVIFGVLTLIGSCMLLMVPVREFSADKIQGCKLKKSILGSSCAKLLVFFMLFVLFKDVNGGVIGTGMLHRIAPVIPEWTIPVPNSLYRNLITAYFGFPPAGFYSTDYFALLPWGLLYLCGYELHFVCRETGILDAPVLRKEIPVLSFMGRNSLLIYLLHQPVLYVFVLLYGSMG